MAGLICGPGFSHSLGHFQTFENGSFELPLPSFFRSRQQQEIAMLNRYAPPTATVSDGQLAPGSAIKGVLAGLAVDVIGTMLGGIAIGIVYVLLKGANGQSIDSVNAAAAQAAAVGSPVNILSLIVGSIFSVLGGYVCERLARRRSLRVGWVLGGIDVVLGLLLSGHDYPMLQMAGLSMLTLGCVLLGTRLGWRTSAV